MERLKPKRDFTEGPLFFRIILFSLPIMASGILQILYNMADNIVVGKFSGDEVALAAVGSTASLTNLIVNFLLGITAGTSIVVAQAFGAKDNRRVERAVHTSMALSVYGGLLFMAIGLLAARPALVLMGTKAEVLEKAVLYFSIISLGIPASSIYNFGASILRSVGDSKNPLTILGISGLVNVILNLVFVLGFHMSVAGVAIATIVSQYLSAVWIVILLLRNRDESYGLYLKKLRIERPMLSMIIRYGLPTGIQSSLFSITNVLLSSAVNTFPTTTVSAKTIASNIDGLSYTAMNSFSKASLTFVGQNYGANKYDRVKKSVWYSFIQVIALGVLVTQTELIFGSELAYLFVDKAAADAAQIVKDALEIMSVILGTYFLCGMMEVLSGSIRGMGYSMSSMVISLIGACFFRIFWIEVLFNNVESMQNIRGLFMVYPVSWIITICMQLVLLFIALRRMSKAQAADSSAEGVAKKS